MKHVIILTFVAVAALIAVIALSNKNKPIADAHEPVFARIVKPNARTDAAAKETETIDDLETAVPLSLIALNPNEILLNAVSIDMNNDSMDDQIISIKKTGNANIFIITGLYDKTAGEYRRVAEIETEITQTKTFSFSVIDLTGTHTNALTYTGLTDSGETVLKAYQSGTDTAKTAARAPRTASRTASTSRTGNARPSAQASRTVNQNAGSSVAPGTARTQTTQDASELSAFTYTLIADLKADGNIFIQQLQRDDAYSLALAKGESFPICVSTSDTSRGADSLDQIQRTYNWNAARGTYELVSESRVTGKKIADDVLRRIQDGKLETFETFLSGLWYKSSTQESALRYIFFDPAAREIILTSPTTQEIYLWNTGSLRRGGIYLTSMNSSINNLIRRFDITLNGIDEIRIKINDDVKMVIGEETLWDGTYKKTQQKSLAREAANNADIIAKIESGAQSWAASGGTSVIIKNAEYTATTDTHTATGALAALDVQGETLVQFRVLSGSSTLSGSFLPTLDVTKNEDGTATETLTLTPVSVTPHGFSPTGDARLKLTRPTE